ncbi:MAG TPA: hypothetical protein P5318_03980 [Candidatus Hydrogenedentes bacterium]|nr:hypothetical protein [Candidatus Hydrogenedentota bacterium]HRT19263.1 hypothetical protein [Candidatus Hydrogenedentota bacterium]HRT63343.1 hypothetical protein [Candidatus Hydrogenedentota bacterium]
MGRRVIISAILLGIVTALAAQEAVAWGSRARRAICATAVPVERKAISNAFRTEDTSYEEDLFRGAVAGASVLNRGKPFASEAEAIAAIDNEIRLLRDVRKFGLGSYFAFRMGAVAATVSDLLLPFSMDTSPQGQALKQRIEADIEARVDSFAYLSRQKDREYVRNAPLFIENRRSFYANAGAMIADDYRRGSGYEGYLKEGAQSLFAQCVDTTADVWYTILRPDADPGMVAPSPEAVCWYLVREVQYLLGEKKNFYQATKAYDNFVSLGVHDAVAIDTMGDLFYAFGSEDAVERGVREWQTAYEMAGADRRSIGKKLSAHYAKIGDAALEAAARPGASEQELPNALNAFTRALEYEQTNDAIADKITETNAAIADRKARRELNVSIIASAEKVKAQAEKSRLASDYGNAIATYNQAMGLYEAVDQDFADQANTAKESIKQIKKNITDIINQVLDAASDTIDKGNKAVDEHRFEDANAEYERVPNILTVIPGDETTTQGKEKRTLIEMAKKKIDECKVAKQRWEELQRQREEAAKAAAAKAGVKQ